MAGKLHKRHVQLTLDRARKPTGRGGWRPNAGRKKKAGAISHHKRPELAPRFPVHVTIRLIEGAPRIARDWLMKIIRPAMAASHKPWFRIAEFNVLDNHLHLVTEAASKQALARGMIGLQVRLVRRLNRALRRRGQLVAHRYHAVPLTTPTQVRNALRYVLLNRKHHAPATAKFSRYWIDACSSAPWFTGWAEPIRTNTWWMAELCAQPPPTVKPRTWLLAVGWKLRGLLRFDDRPA